MEIEAKFRITGPLDRAAFAALDLAPYTLRTGAELDHDDLLLDTPTRAITGSHHSLRLRDENGATILTFKGPGTVAGSIHQRDEIETQLPEGAHESSPDGAYDYTVWPEQIARRVAQLVGEEHHLRPLIEIRVHRATWIVERGGVRVGELALDEGMIHALGANGASTPVHELELELKGAGTMQDLATLGAYLCQLLPLAPEPRSKLERGLALLAADESPAPPNEPEPLAHAATPVMTGYTPLQVAARHAIGGYLHKLRKNAHKVRSSHRGNGDPEAIHDMRVATRRIRATLQLLEGAPGFDSTELRTLRRHLRSLAHRLGAVRDLEVFLAGLAEYETAHPEAVDGLRPLRRTVEHRREAAREKLLRALHGARLEHRQRQLERFATQPVDISAEPRPVLVRHFAGGALWRRYGEVLRFECELPGAPTPDLHKLRIACKRARYALDLFEPALGPGTKSVTDALVAAQDHLGALQDTVVALATVEEVRANGRDHHHHADAEAALATYADALALRRDDLHATFAPLWQRISDYAFRAELAALIAGL